MITRLAPQKEQFGSLGAKLNLAIVAQTKGTSHYSFFQSLTSAYLAWMPDELSPAHNIVCWGCSVWHRSVEEKLSWYENQPDQSNCQGGLHTMLDRSPVRSSRAGPRAGLPGRSRGSRAGPLPGLPGRERGSRAAELRAPARGTHGARTWLRGGALPARGGFHSHLETFCTF